MKSLPEFIKELQNSSYERQTHWVWAFSVFSFLFIFSIWGVTLKYGSSNNIIAKDSTPNNELVVDHNVLFTINQGLATIKTTIKNTATAKNVIEINNPIIKYQPNPSPLPPVSVTEFPN